VCVCDVFCLPEFRTPSRRRCGRIYLSNEVKCSAEKEKNLHYMRFWEVNERGELLDLSKSIKV